MKTALLTILAVVAIGALYVVVPVVVGAYRRYRGVKTPICPETGERVGVELDARHAAVTAAFGEPDLHVKRCTRWPEHHDCDEACRESIREEELHEPEARQRAGVKAA
jgi:hypothetical protein